MMGILFYGLFGALTIGAAYLVKTEVPAFSDVSEGSEGAPGIQHAWGRRHAPSRRSALNGAALLFLFAALAHPARRKQRRAARQRAD